MSSVAAVATRVLLVEDVVELRAVVRQALRLRGGFDVVAEAGDGTTAVAAAHEHQPDVVVLDLGLPDLAGRELLTRLRAAASSAQVVVYTGSITPERSGIASEVDAFVKKDRDVGYLVDLLDDLSRAHHQTATTQLGPALTDVAIARRFLAEQCRRWGCHDVVEDGELVVTELVGNAMLHAGAECLLRARLAHGVLRLEVFDDGGGVPDPLVADIDDEHGRGLLLVSVLSTAWGVESSPGGGKVVWAELASSAEGGGGERARRGGVDRPVAASDAAPVLDLTDTSRPASPGAPATGLVSGWS